MSHVSPDSHSTQSHSTERPTQDRNARLFARAGELMPGGVSSPVRAYGSVGGSPPTIRSGRGAWVKDANGRLLLDMVSAWGAQILGHADPRVVARIRRRALRGTVFGAPAVEETHLAQMIASALPGAERVRFVSTGTEACMSVLRLARGATGRNLVIKCAGNYHGHSDALLSSAGSGALTLGVPDSPGVPASWAACTLTAETNDLPRMASLLEEHGDDVAAVIIEPVVGNMGCVPPDAGWLEGVRDLAHKHGALFVLDEVMTGFRVAWGGAQVRYGVEPDLTCLAKVIGGGMPVGAYAGRAELMDQIAPAGPIYQAGTLSGNPISMAAGIATMRVLREPGTYERLEANGGAVERVLADAAADAGVSVRIQRVGSMLTVFFTDPDRPVRNLADSSATRTEQFGVWHAALLENGVHWPPSSYEAAFLNLCHGEEEVAALGKAARAAFAAVAASVAARGAAE